MTFTQEQVAHALTEVRDHLERTQVVKGDANIIKAKHIVHDLIKGLS